MKLKRYTASNIRQAMAKVRDELGHDAVILSNRKTDDGIEIIAAMDYDDSIVKTPLKTKKEKNSTVNSNDLRAEKKLKNTNESQKVAVAKWKKSFEESYESIEARETQAKVIKKSKIANQVSDEWVNQLKPKLEEETLENKNQQNTVKVVGTNDDELRQVWGELSSLRGLLETQLSSLAWSDISKRKPMKMNTLKHFLELGLTPDISYEIIEKLDDKESFESCWRKGLAIFATNLPIINEDIVNNGGIFALVGPTGVGKTTTIAKLAARYALDHGTDGIALVTTDNYRIGAQEQLRTYGRILGTPVKVANNAEELRNILKGLYDKDLILIDTAGMSQRDMKLTEQFSMLSEGSILIKIYLVISASSQKTVLDETVQAYKKAFLDGCIITKLDETLSLGGALSVIYKHKLPVSYTSNGQRVPEDLHRASAIGLVKSAVKMMNQTRVEMDENVVELAYGEFAANDLV